MVKNIIFCKMIVNITHWHTSNIQNTQDMFFLVYFKALTQTTLCKHLAMFCLLVTEKWPKV